MSPQFVTGSLMFFTSPMLQIRDGCLSTNSTSTSCKARATVTRFTSLHGRIQWIGHRFHCLVLVSRSDAAGGRMWWGMPFQTRFTRPDSLMLLLHASCLYCTFPDARLDVIDAWLERHLQYPAKRGGRVLNRLPTAGRREVMTIAQSAIQVW